MTDRQRRRGDYYDVSEILYQPPGGKLHREGCRYFVPPGADAIVMTPEVTSAFWALRCKRCSEAADLGG